MAGVICGGAIVLGERGRFGRNRLPVELAAMVLVGVISVVAAIAIA